MADDPRQGQFGRRWSDEPIMQDSFWERQPEKPPPEKQQRPAPDPKSQPPLSPLSNKQNLYNSRSAPRRKRRQNQPSFRVVKIARRFLAPERRS
jgi:hypothetical protein